MGQNILIPPNLVKTSISNQFLIPAGTPKSYTGGKFQIRKLWHTGDSRNINPQSWATHIEAVAL